MFINDSYVACSMNEAINITDDLRKEGYKCVEYYNFYEYWQKGDHVVYVDHDF